MAAGFFEHPILNSPYEEPSRHHALDEAGQPTNLPPIEGRRKSALISPVPAARKQNKRAKQDDLFTQEEADAQEHTLTIINEIRGYVSAWRRLHNPSDWGVTPVTQRLLKYWREHEFATVKPFFCQPVAGWIADFQSGPLAKLAQLPSVYSTTSVALIGGASSVAMPLGLAT